MLLNLYFISIIVNLTYVIYYKIEFERYKELADYPCCAKHFPQAKVSSFLFFFVPILGMVKFRQRHIKLFNLLKIRKDENYDIDFLKKIRGLIRKINEESDVKEVLVQRLLDNLLENIIFKDSYPLGYYYFEKLILNEITPYEIKDDLCILSLIFGDINKLYSIFTDHDRYELLRKYGKYSVKEANEKKANRTEYIFAFLKYLRKRYITEFSVID